MAEATPPPPNAAASPVEHLLADGIQQIGRLCELLSRGVNLQPAVPAPAGTGRATVSVRPGVETASVPPRAVNDPTGVGAAVPLGAFLGAVNDLTPEEQGQVIDAALTVLEQVYVHLPLKRAMYAVEPIQRLRLLRQRHHQLSGPRAFHDEMLRTFHSLRDLHTNYVLPAAYQGRSAYLPFLVEEYYESGPPRTRRYAVTRLLPGFTHPLFAPGVRVTHWSGVPIERAVELNADREAGSNLDARMARGLEALTIRPMALTAPPDEGWVVVGYEAGGAAQELRFEWKVFLPPASPTGVDLAAVADDTARVLGVDARTEAVRRARKSLFDPASVDREVVMAAAAARAGLPAADPSAGPDAAAQAYGAARPNLEAVDLKTETVRRSRKALFFPESVDLERRMGAAVAAASAAAPVGGPTDVSLMPDVFSFKRVPGPQGELGYVRVATFMVTDANAFVAEFTRIARLLPQRGLILDVRGNGGGNILAGERLLQVLTPQAIEPERFHFINTEVTLGLCRAALPGFDLQRWEGSIGSAIETGETYSQGLPLGPAEDYNRIGQQYQGPVVLVVDALCYSTTDIFTAGFQDHRIGKVLGVHRQTGAGGANVWEYRLLNSILGDRFPALPKGANLRVAVRRTTRVKERSGVPVEDLGVQPDATHDMTRRDLLEGNPDLIAAAANLFQGVPVRSLAGTFDPAQAVVRVNAANVDRVDVYQDGRPLATGDVTGGENGTAVLKLAHSPAAPGRLQLRGFAAGELVVVGWITP